MNKFHIFLGFILSVLIYACQNNQPDESFINHPINEKGELDTVGYPHLVFLDANSEFDFGRITEGKMVTHEFIIKNTGKKDLIISNVDASCGCTVPREWPKHPLKSGETGKIIVHFDSEGRANKAIKKTIRVYANTYPKVNYAYLVGEVIGIEE